MKLCDAHPLKDLADHLYWESDLPSFLGLGPNPPMTSLK
jgi:hypothetical protein